MNDITIPAFTVGQRVRGTGTGMSDKSEQGIVTRIEYVNGRVYVDITDDAGNPLVRFHPDELTTELNAYVQVAAGGYSRLTYIDPSEELEVGDRVLVPMGYRNRETFGKVIALGRGTYSGECKSVSAKLEATELTA